MLFRSLHRIFKAARYPVSLARLMEETGRSRATVYRDIAFLRDALGAPIESDGENAAFHYATGEAERFELPGLWLSSEELQALLALNELVGRTGPGILATALAPFRSRIDRLLSDQGDGKSFPVERIRVIGYGTRRVDEATFRHVASAVLGRGFFQNAGDTLRRGVEASVSLATEKATVRFAPQKLDVAAIIQRVRDSGYDARVARDRKRRVEERHRIASAGKRDAHAAAVRQRACERVLDGRKDAGVRRRVSRRGSP